MIETTALQRLVRFGNGSDYKEVEAEDGPFPVYGSGGQFARAYRYLYDGESVLFGRKGTVDRPLYVNGKFWTVDTMYYTVPGPLVESKFLYYWATTIPFDLYSTNTALPSMTSGTLGRLQFPLLARDKQRRIADYLDRETATIDALIAKQRELIGGLQERRGATIENALTTSGNAIPVKRCADLLPGYAFPSADFAQGAEGPLLLRGINVKPRSVNWVEAVSLAPTAEAPSALYTLRRGDLVLGMDRPFVGGGTRVAMIDGDSEGSLLVQRVMRLRPTGGTDARMLAYALAGAAFRTQIETEFTGISVPHLSESQVGRVKIPMPPLDEQRKIADHLDRETVKIDALIAKAERFIELGQERRAALITAAVTGQIEIPTED